MYTRNARIKTSFYRCIRARSSNWDHRAFGRSQRTWTTIQKSCDREALGVAENFFRGNHSGKRVHLKSKGLMSNNVLAYLVETFRIAERVAKTISKFNRRLKGNHLK